MRAEIGARARSSSASRSPAHRSSSSRPSIDRVRTGVVVGSASCSLRAHLPGHPERTRRRAPAPRRRAHELRVPCCAFACRRHARAVLPHPRKRNQGQGENSPAPVRHDSAGYPMLIRLPLRPRHGKHSTAGQMRAGGRTRLTVSSGSSAPGVDAAARGGSRPDDALEPQLDARSRFNNASFGRGRRDDGRRAGMRAHWLIMTSRPRRPRRRAGAPLPGSAHLAPARQANRRRRRRMLELRQEGTTRSTRCRITFERRREIDRHSWIRRDRDVVAMPRAPGCARYGVFADANAIRFRCASSPSCSRGVVTNPIESSPHPRSRRPSCPGARVPLHGRPSQRGENRHRCRRSPVTPAPP